MRMKLFEDVQVLCPNPAAFIETLDAVVIGDLHLGYEAMLAERGVFLPKTQLKKQLSMLEEVAAAAAEAERLIINGDLKHEFGGFSYQESREVESFLKTARELFGEVWVVRGNHDNFLAGSLKRLGVSFVEEVWKRGVVVFHGHRMPGDAELYVLAHEHPAVVLHDEIGAKEKLRCFLYGRVAAGRVVVLPAFSPLAAGSEVNLLPKSELLSPFLRSIETDRLRVLAVSREAGCLEFATLGEMRRFA